jgi:hypothetical protein
MFSHIKILISLETDKIKINQINIPQRINLINP